MRWLWNNIKDLFRASVLEEEICLWGISYHDKETGAMQTLPLVGSAYDVDQVFNLLRKGGLAVSPPRHAPPKKPTPRSYADVMKG